MPTPPPPSAPADGPTRPQVVLAALAHAAAVAFAAFVPLSIAGMHITLAVMLGALVLLRATGVRAWERSALDAPSLLFAGAAILSIGLAAIAGSPPTSWHTSTLWRSFLVPLLVLSALSVRLPGDPPDAARRRAVTALGVWAVAALLPALLAWVQFENGFDLLHALGLRSRPYVAPAPRYPGHYAAVGLFWWYTVFAHNLTSPLLVAASLALHDGLSRRARLLLGAAAIVVAPAIALSLSRAAWIALAAGAFVVVALRGRRFALRALLPMAAAFALVAVGLPALRNRLSDALSAGANQDRIDIWEACAAMRADYPLTGVGWGNLKARGAPYWDRFVPEGGVRAGCHDVFYSTLVEGGPLLLLAGLAWWALLARAAWRWRSRGDALARGAAAGALAATLALLLNGLWHDVFWSSEPMYGFALALAVAAAICAPSAAQRGT
jgi:O-antigen ligase